MKAFFWLLCALTAGSAGAIADRSALLTLDSLDAAWQMPASLAFAEQALAQDPEDCALWIRLVRAQVNVAEEAMDAGHEKEASEGFAVAQESSRRMVEACPGESMAHYYRALALGRRALFAGGREKVELSQEIEREGLKALELDPDNGMAHGLLGRYYREMANLSWLMRKIATTLFGELSEGGNDLALEHLQRAVELQPEWIFAHVELGETFALLEQNDEARREYARGLELPELDHRDHLLKAVARNWLEKHGH